MLNTFFPFGFQDYCYKAPPLQTDKNGLQLMPQHISVKPCQGEFKNGKDELSCSGDSTDVRAIKLKQTKGISSSWSSFYETKIFNGVPYKVTSRGKDKITVQLSYDDLKESFADEYDDEQMREKLTSLRYRPKISMQDTNGKFFIPTLDSSLDS